MYTASFGLSYVDYFCVFIPNRHLILVKYA